MKDDEATTAQVRHCANLLGYRALWLAFDAVPSNPTSATALAIASLTAALAALAATNGVPAESVCAGLTAAHEEMRENVRRGMS